MRQLLSARQEGQEKGGNRPQEGQSKEEEDRVPLCWLGTGEAARDPSVPPLCHVWGDVGTALLQGIWAMSQPGNEPRKGFVGGTADWMLLPEPPKQVSH